MRRSAVSLVTAILVVFMLGLASCGGGGGSSSTAPASIAVSPTSISIDPGGVYSISAAVYDSNQNVVSNPPIITFASSNTAVATVSSAGAVCGGTWDTNHIVCTPGTTGSANITATSGSLSATVPVYVHAHVDRLVVSAPATCTSQSGTAQLSVQALSNGADITSTVGPINWTSASTAVATVDSNGLVTAVAPGQSNVYASVSGINSVPAAFITCPVKSIFLHAQNATADTSFSLAPEDSEQLAADVLDAAGNAVTVSLTWASSQPLVAGGLTNGLLIAAVPGTAQITATCSGGCNIGLPPVYSNVVTATVTGNSANPVYATGTGATSLIPIDTATNTAGMALTLPAQPNSFLFDPLGAKGYLGSSGGLMTLDISTNTITNNASYPGKVLAVSPDGKWVIIADSGSVYGYSTVSGGTSQALSISGATSAVFTPDSAQAFIAAGNTLYTYTPGSTPSSQIKPAVLTSATMLASGAFAYFASPASGSVLAVASCNAATADTVTTPGSPALMASLPNGSAVLAVDSPGIEVITPSSTLAGCPPPLTDTIASTPFGAAFTARQIIVLPDSSHAYITSDVGLLGYTVANGTATALSPILLAGTATFTGGATLDSKSVYVGGSDNAVHVIDVATGNAQQIPLSFTPDLVAVRPR